MKTLGIIVEYNPFHNGHLYQIQTAKKITGADYVVVVMSGSFVQRGGPAIINKYNRTKMCLDNEVDLIIELPVCYAVASAEFFAKGAVSVLNNLGIIDFLCFGSEFDNLPVLEMIADLLAEEPPEYKSLLKYSLKAGLSFPKSRGKALCGYLLEKNMISSLDMVYYENLLSSSNSILGIEYLKALKLFKSRITPLLIKRTGSGYHNPELDSSFSSAAAIRNHLLEERSFTLLSQNIPKAVCRDLQDNLGVLCPITEDDFSLPLGTKLLEKAEEGFTQYFDVSKELSCRIQNHIDSYQTFGQFSLLLKTKSFTQTRINRVLLHILLELKTEDMEIWTGKDFTFYARILGFKKVSSPLLKKLKEETKLPILTKLADAPNIISGPGLAMLEHNIQADHLYRLIVMNKFHIMLPNEYSQGIIIAQ